MIFKRAFSNGSLKVELEPMAMLWIHLCVGLGRSPDFAFKIVKR